MATEERLIKASTLLKAIELDKVTWRFGVPDTLDTMVDFLRIIINEQPAVDAVEVVHGRWEPRKDVLGFVRCSVCHDCNIYGDWADGKKWKYCPNCGAKMDGDGNG